MYQKGHSSVDVRYYDIAFTRMNKWINYCNQFIIQLINRFLVQHKNMQLLLQTFGGFFDG